MTVPPKLDLLAMSVQLPPDIASIVYLLDRCSTSGGEPEDPCMIVVYVAEAGSEGFHNQ